MALAEPSAKAAAVDGHRGHGRYGGGWRKLGAWIVLVRGALARFFIDDGAAGGTSLKQEIHRVPRNYGFVTMSSKPGLFKQIDVKRAFEAAQLAGIEVASVDIDRTGKISIVPKNKTGGDDPAPKKSPGR